jgi:hypothetical protein
MGVLKNKLNKFILLVAAVIFLWIAILPLDKENRLTGSQIKRLTFTGENAVHFPSLSDDGRWMLYVLEIKEGENSLKAIKVMNIEEGKERELFRSRKIKAPAPFQNVPLAVGSKPPILSGNGQVAVFSLSLEKPANILDHYLGIINTDGTNFRIIPFPITDLKGKDLKSLDFLSGEWERISNYALSSDGTKVACVLKGHLGPRRYGHPSGIAFLDALSGKQKTILTPDFDGKQWIWSTTPRRPLTGGGWAFCMSGNGQKIVFGAQSSEDPTDYDLFMVDWDGKEMRKLTDFHDRWFSLADISHDSEKVVFFYNGRKKQGIGTYAVNSDGSGLEYLESKTASQVELYDLSGNGRYVLFKHVYKGMIWDLFDGQEILAFDEHTPGYASNLIPMDFPQIPAFWGPNIVNFKGDKILLFGHPQGKTTPEIYILTIDLGKSNGYVGRK